MENGTIELIAATNEASEASEVERVGQASGCYPKWWAAMKLV